MNLFCYFPGIKRIGLRAVLLFCLYLAGTGRVWAQNVYAGAQRNGTTGPGGNAGVVANAVNTNYTDSTHMTASSVIGTSTAYIQMIFTGGALPANTTVYIKYKSTGALLGGGITLRAYSSSTTTADGNPETTTSEALTAPDGTKYLAVTSTAAFNAVRVTLSSPVALGTNTADIFYAYYVTAGSGCHTALATSTATAGVSLAAINTPNYAIDGNVNTASDFNFTLSLLGTLTQTIYCQGISATGDVATLTLSVPPAVLSVGVLGSISITLYRGNTQVGSPVTMGSLLSADLLGLLGDGNPYTVSFTPAGTFDRVVISMSSAVGLLNRLYLNEVAITPPKPVFTLPVNDTVYVCNGGTATVSADAPSAGNELRWFSSALATNTTVLYTGNSYPLPFAITRDTVVYVATGKTGCTPSSERVPVRILLKPSPGITFSSPIYTCQHSAMALLVYTATTNSPAQYSIAWSGAAATAGFQNVSATTFPVSPINITVPGAAAPASYSGVLTLTGANTCTQAFNFTLTIQSAPHPPPPVTSFQ